MLDQDTVQKVLSASHIILPLQRVVIAGRPVELAQYVAFFFNNDKAIILSIDEDGSSIKLSSRTAGIGEFDDIEKGVHQIDGPFLKIDIVESWKSISGLHLFCQEHIRIYSEKLSISIVLGDTIQTVFDIKIEPL